jgi:hypothetical protein
LGNENKFFQSGVFLDVLVQSFVSLLILSENDSVNRSNPMSRVSRQNLARTHATNDFLRPFTFLVLIMALCFVASISHNGDTTGKDLTLPQFETSKGYPVTTWLRKSDADKQFWRAADSMAGAPISSASLEATRPVQKQLALKRLMLKMRHDIEEHGFLSKSVEAGMLKSLEREANSP